MVALVLAEQKEQPLFEGIVLTKLKNYTKPVKTKNLATRLKVDRPRLVEMLNELKERGLIRYTSPRIKDKRYREDYYGWIIV